MVSWGGPPDGRKVVRGMGVELAQVAGSRGRAAADSGRIRRCRAPSKGLGYYRSPVLMLAHARSHLRADCDIL